MHKICKTKLYSHIKTRRPSACAKFFLLQNFARGGKNTPPCGIGLSESEISLLSKGLLFCPTPVDINEEQLRLDFDEFSRQMRNKWYFKDSLTEDFSETPAFKNKSTWQAPQGSWNPYVEVFLSELEADLFSVEAKGYNRPNLTKEEREAIKSLSSDRSIVIKEADKGSAVVVWDREDYIKEAERQLSDKDIYTKIRNNEKRIPDLAKRSNEFMDNLFQNKHLSKKEREYLTWETLNSPKYAKMYQLSKIHKKLHNVPGMPVISNCGAVTEKASELLDLHLKPIMQEGKSYLRDTDDFLSKLKELGPLPKNSILVTADVVGLYPSIPHKEGLLALKRALEKRANPKIPSKILIDMAEFVLKNNFFEFNENLFQQLSGTAIGTKFAPPYACIFMDWLEEAFLATQDKKPWAYFRYIDDIFIIWTEGEESLRHFLESFNEFHTSIKFE